MRKTPLRARFGYLTGVSAGVPTEVVEALDHEVGCRLRRGERSPTGRLPTRSDVIRDVLTLWIADRPRSNTAAPAREP
jgi:Arc/MetJ-type ribon-helix-helix transcriptional regulator